MRYSYPPILEPIIRAEESLYAWSIRKFVVLIGILLLGGILAVTIFLTYKIVAEYLDQAYARNAQLRALAQAYEINQLLTSARYELDFLTRTPLTAESVLHHWEDTALQERNRFREIAFQGVTSDDRFVLLNTGSEIVNLSIDQAFGGKASVFSMQESMSEKKPGHVQLSDPIEVVYPSVHVRGGMKAFSLYVIRLTTPVYGENNQYKGQLTLAVDLLTLRDIISLHASRHSPLFLYPQEGEQKKTFFFDAAGWLLFQSESSDHAKDELSVDQLRMGLPGDVGRPGFSTAFRPGAEHERYWSIVADVQGGRSGQVLVTKPFLAPSSGEKTLYLSYVPIVFAESPESQRIIGGIGCIDASFVLMASTYQLAGTLAICLLVALVLVFIALYVISSCICRQLEQVSEAVEMRIGGDEAFPLALKPLFVEIFSFQRSINILLAQLRVARSDTILHEGLIEGDRMRHPVDLVKEIHRNPLLDPQLVAMPLYGIVGGSQAVNNLRQQIHKAARILDDVLIVGETGTGKELTAEAIHAASHRAQGPFISINCGALDENLLMDALFGHVKGAFSEAHSDRKGAFAAASGGTLHLDEIGNASPRVQQTLLRALSVRRIRPLGLDQDMVFDARIIAATNVDLLQLAATGEFREDLYYRLAVITINTPPLRERKEDIIVLVKHFLEENAALTGREAVRISRGALEKMIGHEWLGNVRELRNCITRALAFTEGDLLLAQQIMFDDRIADAELSGNSVPGQDGLPPFLPQSSPPKKLPAPMERSSGKKPDVEAPEGTEGRVELNARQRKAWSAIARNGEVTRSEYQAAVGGEISVRTAQYDLHDLVAKGLLKKSGRGPSSRYLVTQLYVV